MESGVSFARQELPTSKLCSKHALDEALRRSHVGVRSRLQHNRRSSSHILLGPRGCRILVVYGMVDLFTGRQFKQPKGNPGRLNRSLGAFTWYTVWTWRTCRSLVCRSVP